MTRWLKEHDAKILEDAARIVRRRKVTPEGMSRAAFCRVLLAEADALRQEARDV